MKSQINYYSKNNGWRFENSQAIVADIVIVFSSPDLINDDSLLDKISQLYKGAEVICLSTGGEIFNDEVSTASLTVAAIKFERTEYKVFSFDLKNIEDSFSVGKQMGESVIKDDLNSLMVFADGLTTNGTALIKGVNSIVGEDIVITGGLAGDDDKFESTKVGLNAKPAQGKALVIAFYGDNLVYGHGSAGGWDKFGPQRLITKAEGNILYELDGQPALELYKKYLTKEQVEELPGSGLLYPLSICAPDDLETTIVRTIVGVNEDDQSLIFAGDINTGHLARLMIGSFDRLVEGASQAAKMAIINNHLIDGDSLTLMISCIGRRLLMGQRISEEAESVHEVLDDKSKAIGFYSYGEISPHAKTKFCQLHNQTMTITHFGEKKVA